MKHFVMVNGKFMVSLEAETCSMAEHLILDRIPGTQSALAFDAETMKTDYFRNCLLSCEMISHHSLAARFADRRGANEAYKKACADFALADFKLQEAREAVEAAEEAFKAANEAYEEAARICDFRADLLKHFTEELNIDPAQHISDF